MAGYMQHPDVGGGRGVNGRRHSYALSDNSTVPMLRGHGRCSRRLGERSVEVGEQSYSDTTGDHSIP